MEEEMTKGIQVQVGNFSSTLSSDPLPVVFTPSDTALSQMNIGIVGDMGTGKTQLVKSLLYQLSKSGPLNRGHVPRMLILDYKKDYISSDFVESIGGKVIEPSRIPLNFFAKDGCTSLNPAHERGRFFVDILNKIYSGIGPVQKVNLSTAIKDSYAAMEGYGREPTLYTVREKYSDAISNKVDSVVAILAELTDSGVFEEDPSKLVSFEDLFDRTTIVNLGALGADQDGKNMLVTIFLNFYFEYMLRIEKQEFVQTDDGRSLRFIDSFLLVDEANNILSYDFDVLESLLLQGREFGVGVILASQYLSHFGQGRTNWKEPLHTWFVHKVPNLVEKDLKEIGITADVKNLVPQVKNLEPFFCVYKGLGIDGRIIRTLPYFELATGKEKTNQAVEETAGESGASQDTNVAPGEVETFHGYELVMRLETGGMAEAFQARKVDTGETVFLKRVRLQSNDMAAIKREIAIYQKLARIETEHVLDVLDVFQDDEYTGFVMEFADGGDLEDYVTGNPAKGLGVEEVQGIGLAIVAGLEELHGEDIVHRDLKPRNILRLKGNWRIADFGISKNLSRGITKKTFQQHGTPGYTAPEQFQGVEAKGSADVYAVGKILVFLLSGQTDADQITYPAWGQLIAKCMTRNPSERPSLAEVKDALANILV